MLGGNSLVHNEGNRTLGASEKADSSAAALPFAVNKTLFLDIVKLLSPTLSAGNIPAKIEGLAFGADVKSRGTTFHILVIANDNDFFTTLADASGNQIPNPNQFFVVGFADADLGGSQFVPQHVDLHP